jgi:hypothetical protein
LMRLYLVKLAVMVQLLLVGPPLFCISMKMTFILQEGCLVLPITLDSVALLSISFVALF